MRNKLTLMTIIFMVLISCSENDKNREITHFPFSSRKTKNLTKLNFSKKFYDAGSASSDTMLTARYDFKNVGDNPLIISSVTPDCNCTDSYLSKDTIAVGDSAYILLKLSTRNKRGKTLTNATVVTNTKTRFYNLALKTTVK